MQSTIRRRDNGYEKETITSEAVSTNSSFSPSKTTYFSKYVTIEDCKHLLEYRYEGADHSMIYQRVLNPMSNYLVNYLPTWLAPNVITLMGLTIVLLTHIVFAFFCPTLQGEAPRWAYMVAGMGLFLYQTLDNLDGKQARRTGSASALGVLFDHGCDSLNVIISCMTLCSVLQLGATWKTLVMAVSGYTGFLCATWEEYYTGKLDLPVVNAPTEGLLVGIFWQLATAFLGPSFWTDEYFSGIQNHTFFVMFIGFGCIGTVISNFIHVFESLQYNFHSIIVAMTRLIPFAVVNVLAYLWFYFSPSQLFLHFPRTSLWILGFLNSKLILHLMLAHLCGSEYHPFRKTLVPFFYLAVHCIYTCIREGTYPSMDEAVILQELLIISCIAYCHIVISVVYEVKEVLQIPVFTITSKKNKAL